MTAKFSVFLLLLFSLAITSGCVSDGSARKDRPTILNTTDPVPTPAPAPEEFKRPDGQVYLQDDFCICQSGKPYFMNAGCDAFCSKYSSEELLLTVNTKVGPDIELNEQLKDFYGWCHSTVLSTVDPTDPDATGIISTDKDPDCKLMIEDHDGNQVQLALIDKPNNNTFKVDVGTLADKTPYTAYVEETVSGATSTKIQFTINEPKDPNWEDPIEMVAISQYFCVPRSAVPLDPQKTSFSYQAATSVHFYFPSYFAPASLGNATELLFCHDLLNLGVEDDSTYPRLGLVQTQFLMWSENDPRFADQNQNTSPDINDKFIEDLKEIKITGAPIFFELKWRNSPDSDLDPVRQGYYMVPWINTKNNQAFCPTKDTYNDDDKFSVLGNIVKGVDTEGLYLAQKNPESYYDAQGVKTKSPTDILMVNESVVSKHWYYIEDKKEYKPTPETIGSRTILFNYPFSATPGTYTKSAEQKVYTIIAPSQLNKKDGVVKNDLKAPDKRFGCIPKSTNN